MSTGAWSILTKSLETGYPTPRSALRLSDQRTPAARTLARDLELPRENPTVM